LHHFPSTPADSVVVAPIIIASVIAIVAGAAGITAWRNRDLVEN
jgi:putative exporter of polyketide antibiotics